MGDFMKLSKIIIISFILVLSLFVTNLNLLTNSFLESNTTASSNNIEVDKIIYLTFDDGPSESTSKILNILDKYEIPATFFVVGPSYKLKNDLLKEIVNHGHQIAIHSYTHEFHEIYHDKDSFLNDFFECESWIKKQTGLTTNLYRFPGGSSNTIMDKNTIKEIIIELDSKGYKHVDWNIDSLDSKYSKNKDEIIKNTINSIKENEKNNRYIQTILLHDNKKKEATIEALPHIIEYCF